MSGWIRRPGRRSGLRRRTSSGLVLWALAFCVISGGVISALWLNAGSGEHMGGPPRELSDVSGAANEDQSGGSTYDGVTGYDPVTESAKTEDARNTGNTEDAPREDGPDGELEGRSLSAAGDAGAGNLGSRNGGDSWVRSSPANRDKRESANREKPVSESGRNRFGNANPGNANPGNANPGNGGSRNVSGSGGGSSTSECEATAKDVARLPAQASDERAYALVERLSRACGDGEVENVSVTVSSGETGAGETVDLGVPSFLSEPPEPLVTASRSYRNFIRDRIAASGVPKPAAGTASETFVESLQSLHSGSSPDEASEAAERVIEESPRQPDSEQPDSERSEMETPGPGRTGPERPEPKPQTEPNSRQSDSEEPGRGSDEPERSDGAEVRDQPEIKQQEPESTELESMGQERTAEGGLLKHFARGLGLRSAERV